MYVAACWSLISQPCAGGVHMAVLPPLTRAEIAAFKRDGFLIKRRA
jgi:hypothetical protein